MAFTKIETDGFVNKVQPGDKVSRFTLCNSRTDKRSGEKVRVYYSVAVFRGEPPAEGELVSVKGNLEVSYSEKDGKKYTNLSILADAADIQPVAGAKPQESPKATAKAPAKDPWEEA